VNLERCAVVAHARAGGGIVGSAATVRTEIPVDGGSRAENGDALASRVEKRHGLERRVRMSPRRARGPGFRAPFACAKGASGVAEIPGEITGGDFLRARCGGAPAVAGFMLADQLGFHHHIRHGRFKTGPLADQGGGFLVRHVPEFRHGFSI
jgi:hypothetical protein